MGNAATKPSRSQRMMISSQNQSCQQAFSRPCMNSSAVSRKISTSSSSNSSDLDDYLDAQDVIHHTGVSVESSEIEEILGRCMQIQQQKQQNGDSTTIGEDQQFMKAVLAFCAHMGGRMDTLDNTLLYDEFRSYSEGHVAKMGMA